MADTPCSIAVLISGSGSNLQSIIDHTQQGHIHANIACVISNNPEAYGLTRAQQSDIPTHVIDHTDYDSREAFDKELVNIFKIYKIKYILLAGFMRVLGDAVINEFQGRILNIHPSLLPKYPGLHTHHRVLEAGEQKHGCSVHFVTEDLDAGPLIIQAIVPILKTDNSENLAKRVLEKEHIIYPLATKWLCDDKLVCKDGTVYFENKPLVNAIELTKELELELQ